MKHSSKKLSQLITQLCISRGIDNIIISPGSRNAPLTIGFSENKNFTCFSIVDERCAAFFALGMAQQHNKPTVLVCSSGSALLNYYPAISEAFYSDIPLVVISADRPPSLIDIGDGQTIKQENVFENHILESCNCIEGDDYINFNQIIISSALNSAITRSGPVHINVPFTEPLYDTSDSLSIKLQSDVRVNRDHTFTEDLSSFSKKWNNSKKKLMQNFCIAYRSVLSKNELYATGTTGRLIEEASNLNVHKFLAGHLGGEQQMGALIEQNQMDLIIYLREPLAPQKHDPDVKRIFHLCDTHNIPLATNLATAEMMIKSLDRGELDWREMYK